MLFKQALNIQQAFSAQTIVNSRMESFLTDTSYAVFKILHLVVCDCVNDKVIPDIIDNGVKGSSTSFTGIIHNA
jgi:hypothetical protein